MKRIIAGKKKYLKDKEVLRVTVPLYDELKPRNVMYTLNFKENDPKIWELVLDLCPEITEKGIPKDREFFFNVLNTLKPNCMDKIVYNAMLNR